MSTKIFAIAQSASVAGDLNENMKRHLHFGELAAMQGAHFLLFPELSLCGYELALAGSCAVRVDAPELNPLRDLARDGQMTVVVGVPLKDDAGVLSLAALAFRPSGGRMVYAKQNLYGKEKEIFAPGCGGPDFAIGGLSIGLAICADVADPVHAAAAASRHVAIYAASVFASEAGYASDAALLAGYARQHSMTVMMANHSGTTGGSRSAGRSSLWAANGNLVAACEDDSETLLFGKHTGNNAWEAWTVPVPRA